MNAHPIIIFNPLKRFIGEEIRNIIIQNTSHKAVIVDSFTDAPTALKMEPGIIIVILDSCRAKTQYQKFDRFFENFHSIPVVAVLDCQDYCLDCPILKKYVWNFISIPFTKQDILLNIQKFLPKSDQKLIGRISTIIKQRSSLNLLKGESNPILLVKAKILQIAPYDVTILLNGETGTGKELCAKMIHYLSPRSDKPFIPLNCGAVPPELFENELFGHKRGAYTHANTTEMGLIAAADGGTLFLDEIEAIAESTQVKLLRFLEEKKYKSLGDSQYKTADVRIISAAKENLEKLVQQNKFREDLYYRLNVVQIHLPPLRDRREDIPILTEHFIERYSTLYGKPIQGVTPEALLKLMHGEWRGNVRELENVLQETIVLSPGGWIEAQDINLKKLSSHVEGASLVDSFQNSKKKVIEKFEKNYLKNLLMICKGNISRAARYAQKDRRAFCRLMKKHQIDPSLYRV
ncbi:MAG: sigma-54 dependent transcriptional regulator [Calditrichia bacterium]